MSPFPLVSLRLNQAGAWRPAASASLVALAVALALTSCGRLPGGLAGSGHAGTESRQVAAFSKIEIEGSADVVVTVSPTASLSVTTDDNLLPAVQTEVVGDTLKIGWSHSVISTLGLKVQVATPTLTALAISGSGTMHADGVTAKAFSISISGSGDITAKGTSDTCDIGVSGSGDVEADTLATHDASVAIVGSGSVIVSADHSLDASITGSGSIRYVGNPPQIKKAVEGIGSIEPR